MILDIYYNKIYIESANDNPRVIQFFFRNDDRSKLFSFRGYDLFGISELLPIILTHSTHPTKNPL
jgi:hypothetical protein